MSPLENEMNAFFARDLEHPDATSDGVEVVHVADARPLGFAPARKRRMPLLLGSDVG